MFKTIIWIYDTFQNNLENAYCFTNICWRDIGSLMVNISPSNIFSIMLLLDRFYQICQAPLASVRIKQFILVSNNLVVSLCVLGVDSPGGDIIRSTSLKNRIEVSLSKALCVGLKHDTISSGADTGFCILSFAVDNQV